MKDRVTSSVVMATYNGELYLKEQIESVLRNMREEDELIISDDGSTDCTIDIIMSYLQEDSRIKLVSGPQKGVIYNFENGLKYVSKDVIFLCDQDDVWTDDKMEKVLAVMSEDVTLVMHDAIVFEGDKVVVQSFMQHRGSKMGILNNVIKNSYIGCCMAFKKEVLEYILPFPKKICMHDQWIGLINEKIGRSKFISDKLLNYRRHGNNATSMQGMSIGAKIKNRIHMIVALGTFGKEQNAGRRKSHEI